jgi:hypothetical protein
MKRLISIVFLCLILCILVSCKPMPSAVLQDKSCSPPCWEQITPGQTQLQAADSKLRSIAEVDSRSIKIQYSFKPNDGISFDFLPNLREDGGEIFSQKGIVEAIIFFPKNNALTLSEALQEWGLPDRYLSIYYSQNEIPNLVTIIIYSDRGILLGSGRAMSSREIPRFENNLPIEYFLYTNSSLIDTILVNGLISYKIHEQDLLEGLRPWNGLGEIHYLER